MQEEAVVHVAPEGLELCLAPQIEPDGLEHARAVQESRQTSVRGLRTQSQSQLKQVRCRICRERVGGRACQQPIVQDIANVGPAPSASRIQKRAMPVGNDIAPSRISAPPARRLLGTGHAVNRIWRHWARGAARPAHAGRLCSLSQGRHPLVPIRSVGTAENVGPQICLHLEQVEAVQELLRQGLHPCDLPGMDQDPRLVTVVRAEAPYEVVGAQA
mmetsp:Transcript_55521/g.132705  ORF Transcript_55521/g.132705 Transcript_55521/m.132705 type:complete len:216 (-) Transcript_55521:675-1322(-)